MWNEIAEISAGTNIHEYFKNIFCTHDFSVNMQHLHFPFPLKVFTINFRVVSMGYLNEVIYKCHKIYQRVNTKKQNRFDMVLATTSKTFMIL